MSRLPPVVEVAGIAAYRADSAAARALFRCRRLEVERDAAIEELRRVRSELLLVRVRSALFRGLVIASAFAAGALAAKAFTVGVLAHWWFW